MSVTCFAQSGNPFSGGTPVLQSQSDRFSFELIGHRIYIPVSINHSGKIYKFILDTGAFTSMDQRTAEELGLQRGSSLKVEGKIKFAYLLKDKISVRLGDMEVKNFQAAVMDYSTFYTVDPGLCGFLGSDFLKYFYVSIDYLKNELILADSPFPVSSGGYRIPIDTRNEGNLPRIQCRVNDRWSWPGLIDTGAPFALVFPLEVIEKEGWRPAPLIESRGVMASWPNSPIGKNYLGRLGTVKTGPLELTDMAVLFSNTDDIIWGYELLSQFRIFLHYPDNELFLIPYGKVKLASNFFSTGIKLSKTPENKTLVEAIWKGSPAEQAGLPLKSEVISLNSRALKNMSINDINQILNNDRIAAIELVYRDGYREKKILLKKAPLLPATH